MANRPIIDIHSHVVPKDFPPCPVGCDCALWPRNEQRETDKVAMVLRDRDVRILDRRSWNAAARLTDMDDAAIGLQVLSPMPELLSYWLDPSATLDMARFINDVIRDMIAAAPARFAGFGMVPLQNPDLAARELPALCEGLAGVEIGSNINGLSPGDPIFDPFYAEAERLGLAIFVHALHPVGTARVVGPKRTIAFLNFPIDVALAAASMITGNTLRKFPRLRVAFSHGGGALASILPRLNAGWERMPDLNGAFGSPLDEARRFYYDNLVFSEALLSYLVATFGATQIMAGSDYPFIAGEHRPGRIFSGIDADEETHAALSHGNALRFLGMTAPLTATASGGCQAS
jgi:aminocarboxymuconate-semialdehyde decarboxylase